MSSVRSATCNYCGKKSSCPCESKKQSENCVRNTKPKRPLN